jgi:hypothetical protein
VVSAPAITFVLYSEDGARDSLATVEQLLLGMLRQVCPAVKTNHVQREPALPAEDRVSGSFWKTRGRSCDSQRLRRLLIGHVATALALGKVVFFHVDADAVWAERHDCESSGEHWPRFCKDVLTVLSPQGKGAGPRDQTELEQVLILAMPFYELEGWAFANTARLREILTSAEDLAALTRWDSDLAALDEIADIKDELSIRDAHNLELVQSKHGFPVAALEELGKSYAATVARLRRSDVVRRGLDEAAARPF